MKILLFGEFSGLYSYLKDGLVELGHDVLHISDGDGYKKLSSDYKLITYIRKGNKLIDRIKYFYNSFKQINKYKNFDVVHLVYDHLFTPVFYNKLIIERLKTNNKSLFLTLAGSNSTVMHYWLANKESKLSILFSDAIKFDGYSSILDRKLYESEKLIASKVNGLIPIMYEYSQPYRNHTNLLTTIPIPINTNKILYQPNIVKEKIVFFHGLNKYGFKGTSYIEEAFSIIKRTYTTRVELIIEGQMPFDKYIKLIESVNVVLDQTSSYSLGVNALISMAMGKVVMGGAELQGNNELNYENCPVFNLRPDVDYIVKQMEKVIESIDEFEKIGYESRLFVEKYHNYINIAQRYIETWQNVLN